MSVADFETVAPLFQRAIDLSKKLLRKNYLADADL